MTNQNNLKLSVLLIILLLILGACAEKSEQMSTIRLIIDKQEAMEKSGWGENYVGDDAYDLNCIGILVSYPADSISKQGVCTNASGSIVSEPTIGAGLVSFSATDSAVLEFNVIAGPARTLELIGFKTTLPHCPPFNGIDDYMQLKSAPMVILGRRTLDIMPGFSEIVLNGVFANRIELEECSGPLFTWQPPPAPGGLLIGGSFSKVNGITQPGFAEIGKIDGELKITMDATLSAGGIIYSMDLDMVQKRIYIGGLFTSFGGLTRSNVAAYDLTNGEVVSSFNPIVAGQVNAIKLSYGSTRLIIGGSITTVNSTPVNSLAMLNTIDGTSFVTPIPAVNGVVNAIDVSDTIPPVAYIGGTFSTVGGIARNRIAAIRLDTNAVVTGFDPNITGTSVDTIVSAPGLGPVYIGGSFTNVHGAIKSNLAAVRKIDGANVVTFNTSVAQTNSAVKALALGSVNPILYVGGAFSTVTATPISRSNLAAFHVDTGALITEFDPDVNVGIEVDSLRLGPYDKGLYFGGEFTQAGSKNRTGMALCLTENGSIIDNFVADLLSGTESVNSIILLP